MSAPEPVARGATVAARAAGRAGLAVDGAGVSPQAGGGAAREGGDNLGGDGQRRLLRRPRAEVEADGAVDAAQGFIGDAGVAKHVGTGRLGMTGTECADIPAPSAESGGDGRTRHGQVVGQHHQCVTRTEAAALRSNRLGPDRFPDDRRGPAEECALGSNCIGQRGLANHQQARRRAQQGDEQRPGLGHHRGREVLGPVEQ